MKLQLKLSKLNKEMQEKMINYEDISLNDLKNKYFELLALLKIDLENTSIETIKDLRESFLLFVKKYETQSIIYNKLAQQNMITATITLILFLIQIKLITTFSIWSFLLVFFILFDLSYSLILKFKETNSIKKYYFNNEIVNSLSIICDSLSKEEQKKVEDTKENISNKGLSNSLNYNDTYENKIEKSSLYRSRKK